MAYTEINTRTELLTLVQPYRNQPKQYELDQLANERGHQIIRLPCYHCQYIPIELVWAQVKREVAEKYSTFTLTDVERLMNEELDNVTQAQWASCVRHAEKLQEDDFFKEIGRDQFWSLLS